MGIALRIGVVISLMWLKTHIYSSIRKCWKWLKRQCQKYFLLYIYIRFYTNRNIRERIKHILATTPQTIFSLNPRAFGHFERDIPASPQLIETGWSKWMITRYLLAMQFSKKKRVLEAGSGLGWGAYLLDAVVKKLICIDIDLNALVAAKSLWPTSNTSVIYGSVLQLPLKTSSVDVVTSMEVLEHLSFCDIKIYFEEVCRVLRPHGIFIGTSFFPDTREEANQVCNKNPEHKYILTHSELSLLLKKYFRYNFISSDRLWFVAISLRRLNE
jgi:SAM-dependent methyltransferase